MSHQTIMGGGATTVIPHTNATIATPHIISIDMLVSGLCCDPNTGSG